MKNRIKQTTRVLLLLAGIVATTTLQAQIVTIPDANFKAVLVGNVAINTNGSDEISVAEAAAFSGTINCDNKNIASLTGIEAFTALTELYCSRNQLTALVVSSNTALTWLECWNNQLTTLNVNGATALEVLVFSNNQLTALDVSSNVALTELSFLSNQLTALDVSSNTALEKLDCVNNKLTALNVSSNTALTRLFCAYNQLTALDVSSNTALEILNCDYNQLTALDVTSNTALEKLDCTGNQLTYLNVNNGKNKDIIAFRAQINSLTCIQVDDTLYSNATWVLGSSFTKDAKASYELECLPPPLPPPPPPTAAANQAFCAGAIVADLAADAGAGNTVVWYEEATGGIAMNHTEILTSKDYYAAAIRSSSDYVSSTTRTKVAVTATPLPAVEAGDDQAVCAGTAVLLTATGAITLNWDNDVVNATSFVPSATTLYMVTGTDANGCSAIDVVTVTVTEFPAKPVIMADFTDAASRKLSVEPLTDASYVWFLDGTAHGEDAADISITEAGSYTVAITVNGCTGPTSDAFEVIITGVENSLLGAYNPYPNPVITTLTLELNKAIRFENGMRIRLITINGKQVFSKSFTSLQGQSVELGMRSFKPGIYIVELTSEGIKQQYKIRKQ